MIFNKNIFISIDPKRARQQSLTFDYFTHNVGEGYRISLDAVVASQRLLLAANSADTSDSMCAHLCVCVGKDRRWKCELRKSRRCESQVARSSSLHDTSNSADKAC